MQDQVLFGKQFAPILFKPERFKMVLGKLWEQFSGMHVRDLVNNTFACEFASKDQAELVLEQAPWFVMGHLFSLQPRRYGQVEASSKKAGLMYGKFLSVSTPKTLSILQEEKDKGKLPENMVMDKHGQSRPSALDIMNNALQDGDSITGQLNHTPNLVNADIIPDTLEELRQKRGFIMSTLKFPADARVESVVKVEVWKDGVKLGYGLVDWVDAHRLVLYTLHRTGMGVNYMDMLQHPIGGWDETVHHFYSSEWRNTKLDSSWGRYDLFTIGQAIVAGQEQSGMTPTLNPQVAAELVKESNSVKRPRQDPTAVIEAGLLWRSISQDEEGGEAEEREDRVIIDVPGCFESFEPVEMGHKVPVS